MTNTSIHQLIGEATAYDKKQMLETKEPKSWLKSVSAFANGKGGALIFGIVDDTDEIVGLSDPKSDSETISEQINAHMDPVPSVDLSFAQAEGKTLIILKVSPGKETPYYFVGKGQRIAFVRVGNESVAATRAQLKELVLRGAGKTYDSLPSTHLFTDMAFTQLRSTHYKRLKTSFQDSDFSSWGIIDEDGNLTNAGLLLADDSPLRHSRIFCTHWNGKDKASGLGEAIDDAELQGSILWQLQEAVSFIRSNSHKRWWKESDHREERPDYPERAVTEVLVNALIHRDYMDVGSEIHIDIYDDRLEVYSPGGMLSGKLIQNCDLLHVPSRRRNPLLADFFSRLNLMERRGSGMKKILEAYAPFENTPGYRKPKFHSNESEFFVTLYNLNYTEDVLKEEKEFVKEEKQFLKEFVKGDNTARKELEDCTKEEQFVKERKQFVKARKEFLKAQRQIYRLITNNPQISAAKMAEQMGISSRQVQKYLKRLTDLNLITREGGRKLGTWRITDQAHEGFFDRI